MLTKEEIEAVKKATYFENGEFYGTSPDNL